MAIGSLAGMERKHYRLSQRMASNDISIFIPANLRDSL
jgi:hypothetical protein